MSRFPLCDCYPKHGMGRQTAATMEELVSLVTLPVDVHVYLALGGSGPIANPPPPPRVPKSVVTAADSHALQHASIWGVEGSDDQVKSI